MKAPDSQVLRDAAALVTALDTVLSLAYSYASERDQEKMQQAVSLIGETALFASFTALFKDVQHLTRVRNSRQQVRSRD